MPIINRNFSIHSSKMVWFKVNVLQPSMAQNTAMKIYLFRDHFELLCNEQSSTTTICGRCDWNEITGIHVDTDRKIITIDQKRQPRNDQYRIEFFIAHEMRQFLDIVCMIRPRMICHMTIILSL